MEKIIIITLILSIFSSCNSSTKEIEYYKNGEIKRSSEMRNGKQHGFVLEYFEDGTVKSQGEWKDGLANGTIKHYYSNGTLKSQSSWKNGREDGLMEKYYKNGKLWNRANLKDGMQVGKSIFYYENGEILEQQVYTDKGDLAYFVKFDSLGNIDTEAVLLIFDSEKDTVNFGENYEVNIHFGVDISGDVELIIGKFDKDYNLIDTIAVLIGNESKEFNYSVKSQKTGVNTVPILVHHVPNEGDTLSADGLIVKHTFFVKSLE